MHLAQFELREPFRHSQNHANAEIPHHLRLIREDTEGPRDDHGLAESGKPIRLLWYRFAAINNKDLPGGEITSRGQEKDHLGDVLRAPGLPERRGTYHVLDSCVRSLVRK